MASVISESESFQDVNGKPIVNGYIYVGAAGQDPKLNPVPIYSNREMTTPIANPQRTDSFGRSVNKIWVPERYSLKVEDSNNVQKLQDLQRGETSSAPTVNLINVQGINDVTAEAVPPVSAYMDKTVYALTVVSENTGAVTLNFGGGAKPVRKNNGDALVAGDWPAGSIQRVTYNGFSDRFDTLTFSTVEITDQINAINLDITALEVKTASQTQATWNAGTNTTESLISAAKLDAKVKTLALGEGQTWQNLTGSRATGTTYTNTTGRAIYVSSWSNSSTSTSTSSMTVDGMTIVSFFINTGASSSARNVQGLVPNGSTYSISHAGGLAAWRELR